MKLKELREQKNISQLELSKQLNMSYVNYNRYENENVEPDIDFLKQIADYYGVTLDYLCDHETKDIIVVQNVSPEKKQAVKILLALPNNYFFKVFGNLETYKEMLQLGV